VNNFALFRYDLLCPEGIVRALRVFMGLTKPPQFSLLPVKENKMEKIIVGSEVRILFHFLKLK
jgi:phenylalanyl-tRNA synthetase beta chain